jgi:hypothetical protein
MNVEIIEESCITCGISFWITVKHQKVLRNSHEGYYCPSGHKQYYSGETDAEKYKRQLSQCQSEVSRLEFRNDRLFRSRNALKGVVTKLKNKGEQK